jgi:sugar diacid utilization regulator
MNPSSRPVGLQLAERMAARRSDEYGLAMPGPVSEALADATRRLEARSDELVAAMLDAIRGIAEYAAIDDPVIWDEVREHAAASVTLFYNVLREGRPPRTKVGQYFARRRVEQGVVSLAALRLAYVSGTRILWGALLREAGPDRDLRDELLERSSWAMAHVDGVTAAISDAYHDAQKSARHRDQLTRDLFDEIIDGDPAAADILEARARLAGLETDVELRAVVLRWASKVLGQSAFEGLPPVAVVAACAEAAGTTADEILAARRANELLLVAPWRGPEASLEQLRRTLGDALTRLLGDSAEGRAGISGRVVGVGALRGAYRECARAIELGEMIDPAVSIHFYDDYVLHDLFDSAPAQGDRLIAQMLDPLLRLGEAGERLIETLDAYLRSGQNLKIAAAELAIHRNTLTYRLEQIRRETRFDFEDPAQRLRIEAALRFLELRRRRKPRLD